MMLKLSIAALLALALLAGCTSAPLPEGVYISPFIGIGVQKQPQDPSQSKPAPVEEAQDE